MRSRETKKALAPGYSCIPFVTEGVPPQRSGMTKAAVKRVLARVGKMLLTGRLVTAEDLYGKKAPSPHVRVTQLMQRPFRPEYVFVPAAIAKHFTLVDIEVEGEPQLASPIPATHFGGKSPMVMPFAGAGQTVTLVIANTSRKPRAFAAMIVGFSAG